MVLGFRVWAVGFRVTNVLGPFICLGVDLGKFSIPAANIAKSLRFLKFTQPWHVCCTALIFQYYYDG